MLEEIYKEQLLKLYWDQGLYETLIKNFLNNLMTVFKVTEHELENRLMNLRPNKNNDLPILSSLLQSFLPNNKLWKNIAYLKIEVIYTPYGDCNKIGLHLVDRKSIVERTSSMWVHEHREEVDYFLSDNVEIKKLRELWKLQLLRS